MKNVAAISGKFRPDIQGMRAVAILLVLVYHAGATFIPGGYVGVDVFFVISGYLITSHLIGELEKRGTIQLGSFWARRMRRLLPASLLVLVATLILARVMLPPLAMGEVSLDAAFTATYLANMWFAYTGTDYLANADPSVFQHYWSLALEEQFYLVWPLILIVLVRFFKSRSSLLIALGAIVSASFVFGLAMTSISQPIAFFTLPARAWELGIGGLVALAAMYAGRLSPRFAAVVGWVGLAMVLAAAVVYTKETVFPGYAAVLPTLGAAMMIFGGATRASTGPVALLQLQPFQFFGTISYSLYLWHWPLLVIPAMYRAELSVMERAGLVMVAVLLAWLTERYVEKPFRSGRWLTSTNARTYLTAAAATVTAIALSLASGVTPRLTSDRTAGQWTEGVLATEVADPGFVPSNLRPALKDTLDSVPPIYADGCHVGFSVTEPQDCSYGAKEFGRTIVLFGDSHAAQWFPALEAIALKSGSRLVSFTKSSCPAADITTWNSNLQQPYTACDVWREKVLNRIVALDPDLIVMSDYRKQRPAQAGDASSLWAEGIETTVRRLTSTADVVVVGDGPTFPVEPAVCLSAHLEATAECAEPIENVVDLVALDEVRKATVTAGGRFIDTREWYCPAGLCSVVRGDVAMYRDNHHITVEASQAMSASLYSALEIDH
ncbi:acyltransferase family protein [Prescottella equi]|uniref:acyltransferase family protein n=1 Tax=Rhodococcus hoagii TaxID=43767 RepID=UPI000A1215DA|nr:acyltransferase family protein [Prescottella equi]ORM11839.1 hypothetical protein A5N77_08860 [Prescottella equi]